MRLVLFWTLCVHSHLLLKTTMQVLSQFCRGGVEPEEGRFLPKIVKLVRSRARPRIHFCLAPKRAFSLHQRKESGGSVRYYQMAEGKPGWSNLRKVTKRELKINRAPRLFCVFS